jgi:exodeoxyribonuclease VII small subunit
MSEHTDHLADRLAAIPTLSFEAALTELEAVVKRLETGGNALEIAIADYEYGNALRSHCERMLQEATLKVEEITPTPKPQE